MAGNSSLNEIKNTIDRLDASQLKVEKNAFDAINSSDTTLNLVRDGLENVNSLSEKIDAMDVEIKRISENMVHMAELMNMIVGFAGGITGISTKTNMLSLNASIEAARAGEMGKGFAVVATQVGELAARSAQAARETNELITNSILAVEDGQAITDQTVEAFGIVVENIEKANRDVEKITEMVRANVDTVAHAVSQIGRISSVVEENVQISENTKQVSSNMADITGKLLEMVES